MLTNEQKERDPEYAKIIEEQRAQGKGKGRKKATYVHSHRGLTVWH